MLQEFNPQIILKSVKMVMNQLLRKKVQFSFKTGKGIQMIQIQKRETIKTSLLHSKTINKKKIKDRISSIILKKKARSSKVCLD